MLDAFITEAVVTKDSLFHNWHGPIACFDVVTNDNTLIACEVPLANGKTLEQARIEARSRLLSLMEQNGVCVDDLKPISEPPRSPAARVAAP